MANANSKGWTGGEDLGIDEAPEEHPQVPPVGAYKVKVVKSEADESAQKQTKHIAMDLEILAPFDGGELGHVRKSVRERLWLTKANATNIKRACLCFGVEPPKKSTFQEVESFAERLLGAEGLVKIGHEKSFKDPDVMFARVADYLTPDATKKLSDGAGAGTAPAVRPPARQPKARGAA